MLDGHCEDCDRPNLCDIILPGTGPCGRNRGMIPLDREYFYMKPRPTHVVQRCQNTNASLCCGRPEGHSGPHTTHILDTLNVHVWDNENDKIIPEERTFRIKIMYDVQVTGVDIDAAEDKIHALFPDVSVSVVSVSCSARVSSTSGHGRKCWITGDKEGHKPLEPRTEGEQLAHDYATKGHITI